MDLLWEVAPYLARGALMTVLVSIVAMTIAVVIGLVVALLRLSRRKTVSVAAAAYVEIVRGTPLLVQLFIIYYGLPQYGIRLSAFTAGVLGLGINYGAYMAEVYRAGILSVDRGQWEAGGSIGLSRSGLLRYIILPQAIPVILPPLGNYFISMLKDSALVSTISVVELLRAAQLRVAITFRAMDIYLIVAAIYFALSYPCSLLIRHFEKRFAHGNVGPR
jgi:ectoine/hydroxyectoine ABC transporter permease protein EhuD